MEGSKVDKLIQEVVVGDVGLEGAKVVVPEARFVALSNRLNRELPIDKICRFLGSRCSRGFLEFYFTACPNVLEYVCSPGAYLQATLQTDLLPKLQEDQLLPAELRQELVKTVTELAVTVPDADFLTIKRVGQVFTPGERQIFVTAIRERLIPNLTHTVIDWKFNYERSREPEEYFDLLTEALQAYREEFADDPEAVSIIEANQRLVREYIAELEEEYPSQEQDYDSDMRSPSVSPVADRIIFDDIDA